MIKFPGLVMVLVTLSFTASADDATLHWKNGDSLAGTLVSADEHSLTWRSSIFTDPLQIEMAYLDRIKFPDSATENVDNAEFRILIRNGDSLSGRLKSMTETTMSFESRRFGIFSIARDQIVSLQRAQNSGVIYSGPRGLNEWQAAFRRRPNVTNGIRFGLDRPVVPQAAPEETEEKIDNTIWFEEPDGSLTTKKTDASLFLPLSLPEKYEIELEVRSTKPLSFLMAVGHDAKNALRIETWVDELVVAGGKKKKTFMKLRTIGEKDFSAHLYAFVDQPTSTMQVYSDTGELLGEINIPDDEVSDAEGLMFRNGDFDLSIHRLRVSFWDGTPPKILSGDTSRVELTDGTSQFGQLQTFDPATETLTFSTSEESTSVPVENVASLMMARQSEAASTERGHAWLRWEDGCFVSGALVSATDETVTFRTDYAAEPIDCSRVHLNQLGLTRLTSLTSPNRDAGSVQSEQTDKFADRIFHTQGTLQGRLVVEGAADAPIQWTPLGGLNASTLQGVENARFVRDLDVQQLSQYADLQIAFPDVLYLKNNDVLPCRISACNEENVQFTSPLTDVRTFAREHVRAIELTAAGRIHQSGFGAKGWKGLSEKQKADPSKLEFRGNIHYSHPEILTGDTVRFRLEWPKQSWASVTVSMFGNGRRDDESCTHVCFNIQPNSLQILDRPIPPNQMMMGMRGVGGADNDGFVAVKDSSADVQLVAHDGNIVVSIDGKPAKTIKLNSAEPGRRGIAFNANVTAVGRQVIVNGRAQQRAGDAVTMSNFEVDNLSGASIRQFIDEESRQAALTIPRFRRDNPPTHVLIAPNGDLLRGRLLAIENGTVVFESRLETLRFDRSRVGAIVWLDVPQKAETLPAATAKAEPGTDNSADNEKPNPASTVADNSEDADGFAADVDTEATMQALLTDGFSITLNPLRLADGRIEGTSTLLGNCSFPAREVRELWIGDLKNSPRLAAYDSWVTQMAREPDWDIPESDGGSSAASSLIGQVAPDFELPLLDGTTFRLSDHQDKIVVLDFWATWCGPCVMALPDYIAATSKFDESKVIFVAVNLQEASDQIRSFLTEKALSPRVALDRSAEAAAKFHVSGIPHTVILGAGNLIEDVHVGYQPGSGESMQTTIQQLLDGSWKRPIEVEEVEGAEEKGAEIK
ncbi:MAG: TlpA disulfide reductase family protein [Planctomycetaceae bacterium]